MEMADENDQSQILKNGKYLLEKVFETYKMELGRKDRLESKMLGYCTVGGIYLTAFLVIETILLDKGYMIKFPLTREVLSFGNVVLCISFVISFGITIFNFLKCYKIKQRNTFDPVGEWDKLEGLQDKELIEAIRNLLFKIVPAFYETNEKNADALESVNKITIFNSIIVGLSFVLLLLHYIIGE
jgi:hypothetical protein